MLWGIYGACVFLGVLVIGFDTGDAMQAIVLDRYRDRILTVLISVFFFLLFSPISWIYFVKRLRNIPYE